MIFIEIEIDGFKFKLQYRVFAGMMTIDLNDYSGVVIDEDSLIDNPKYIKALHEAFKRYAIIEQVIEAVDIYRHHRPDQFMGEDAEQCREDIEMALSQKIIDIEEHRQGLEAFLEGLHNHEIKRQKKISYNTYLGSNHWKSTRQKALERADYQCWNCNANDGLHVHHLTYERVGKERPDDLRVLCSSCHAKTHSPQKESVS